MSPVLTDAEKQHTCCDQHIHTHTLVHNVNHKNHTATRYAEHKPLTVNCKRHNTSISTSSHKNTIWLLSFSSSSRGELSTVLTEAGQQHTDVVTNSNTHTHLFILWRQKYRSATRHALHKLLTLHDKQHNSHSHHQHVTQQHYMLTLFFLPITRGAVTSSHRSWTTAQMLWTTQTHTHTCSICGDRNIASSHGTLCTNYPHSTTSSTTHAASISMLQSNNIWLHCFFSSSRWGLSPVVAGAEQQHTKHRCWCWGSRK